MSYKQRLQKPDTERQAESLELLVVKAKASSEVTLAENRKHLAELKQDLKNIESEESYSLADIIDKEFEIKQFEAKLKAAEERYKTDFSD